MSSQRGNTKRNRAQKHQNSTSFKNNLHDTSKRTKEINNLEVTGCCSRCTEILEWKIKYKKYKPLSAPRKCVRCSEKTVKQAYCILCQKCAEADSLCVKCGKDKDIIKKHTLSPTEEASHKAQLDQELKILSERQRRTFLRAQASGEHASSSVKTKDDGDDDNDHNDDHCSSGDNSDDNDDYETENDLVTAAASSLSINSNATQSQDASDSTNLDPKS